MNKKSMNPSLAIGGQPTRDDLEQLKQEGFRSVVNLRMPDEESKLNPEKEGQAAGSLGLHYQHIPVSSQKPSAEQVEQFRQAVERLPKPVYVHCQGGGRAGAFSLMHLGREAGWNAEEAFRESEKAGYRCESPAMRQLVEDYLGKGAGPAA